MNKNPGTPVTRRTNLLDNKLIKALVRSRLFPGIIAWPTLVVFTVVVYQLLLGPRAAHDNFGTAFTWVLWWPLLPIIFLFLGRFWCAICPFGKINDLVQKFVGSKKQVPRFLRKYGIWIIDAVFILITWSDHIWGVVENPFNSGILLLLITLGVVVSGALFERRTWCRYLCFLGGLSGNYTRAGMLGLGTKKEVCADCKTASCYKGNGKVPGCPMFVFPKAMDTTAECNLCGLCVKSCPHDAIVLTPRIPTSELWFVKRPRFEVAFLALVIMGIVFVQNITMLGIWTDLLRWIERMTGLSNYPFMFTSLFIVAMAIPAGLMLLASLASSAIDKESTLVNFTKLGYALIPLDLAGHIAHNLFHILAEGKNIMYTTLNLFGVTSPQFNAHSGGAALLDSPTIQILQYMLIAIGVIGSLYTAFRIVKSNYGEQKKTGMTFAPSAILIVVFGIINIYLFMMPMSMRM
jgi:ferredoxin